MTDDPIAPAAVPGTTSTPAIPGARRWKPKGRSRGWVAPAIIVAAVVVIALVVVINLVVAKGYEGRPRLIAAVGDPKADGGTLPAGWIAYGSEITCGAKDTARLRFEDGSLVDIGGGARLRIEKPGASEGKFLHLSAGIFGAQIPPQPDGKPLRIATPHGDALVEGAKMTLTVTGATTLLTVDQGSVRLLAKDRPAQTVEAGGMGFLGADPAAR